MPSPRRLFSLKRCERCHGGISSNELVMRAKDYVYHIHCFTCVTCNVPLSKGDQVSPSEAGQVSQRLCRGRRGDQVSQRLSGDRRGTRSVSDSVATF